MGVADELPPGGAAKGFVVTAEGGHERVEAAAVEAVALLSDFWFKQAFAEREAPGFGAPSFTAKAAGAEGARVVLMEPASCNTSPLQLAVGACQEVEKKGHTWTQTKDVVRLVPFDALAPEVKLKECAEKVLAEKLSVLAAASGKKEHATFAVHYEEHSAAQHLSHDQVVRDVADLVSPIYKVDLTNPDLIVLVTVVGGSVAVAVVPGAEWRATHHFNLRVLKGGADKVHPPQEPSADTEVEEQLADPL